MLSLFGLISCEMPWDDEDDASSSSSSSGSTTSQGACSVPNVSGDTNYAYTQAYWGNSVTTAVAANLESTCTGSLGGTWSSEASCNASTNMACEFSSTSGGITVTTCICYSGSGYNTSSVSTACTNASGTVTTGCNLGK